MKKNDQNVKRIMLRSEEHHHCMFEFVYFANPGSVIDGVSVYDARVRLGQELAMKIREIPESFDAIVPIPDTSRIAAQAMSEALGIPVREAIIKNRTIMRTFIIPDPEEREKTALLKYQFIKHLIQGKNLIVVDDSIVRGLTSKRIIKQFKELGARKILFVSTCPPQRYSCFYGVDFPTRDELIAHKKSIDEIREELGADYLIYQNLTGLKRAIGLGENICHACITGEYVTPHARKINELIDQGKIPSNVIAYEFVNGE